MSLQVFATNASAPTATTDGLCGVKITAIAASGPEGSMPATPKHIAGLIDTSGSMRGSRIGNVKKSLEAMLNKMRQGDRLTLVGFCSTADVILPGVLITGEPEQLSELVARVRLVQATTGTNVQLGITKMAEFMKDSALPPLDAVILLTDGDFTEGDVRSATGLNSLFLSNFGSIPVFTIGYGTGYMIEILKAIAAKSGASHAFIDEEVVDLSRNIGQMLAAIETEVARAVRVEFSSALKCSEPAGSTPVEGVAGKMSFNAGYMPAEKDIWVVFAIPPGTDLSTVSFVVKYNIGGEEKSLECAPDATSIPIEKIMEHELRCVVTKKLNEATAAMRLNHLVKARELVTNGLSLISVSSVRTSGLAIIMKAQLEETLEEIVAALAAPRVHYGDGDDDVQTPAALLYRTSAVAGNYSQQRGGTRMRSGVTPGYFSTGSEVYGGDAMCEGVGSGVGGDPVSAVGVGVGGGELVPEPAAPQPTP